MADWSSIVQQYGRLVWETVYRFVENEADAADCFQETFVSALEFSRKETVRNWPGLLKRLAATRALDRLRNRTRKKVRLAQTVEHSELTDERSDPTALAQSNELAEQLRSALARLPKRQAEAFYLRFIEGCNYEEIGDHLDVSANHVGVLLNRAKASLRKRLSAFAPHTVDRKDREVEK